MIDARELRIGNWVLSPYLEPYKIDQIRRDSLNNFPHWLTESDPIPLTEDIILKCGFKKDKLGWHDKYSSFSLTNSLLPAYKEIICSPIKVKYLHQLQNLFFCLCGTELEITF